VVRIEKKGDRTYKVNTTTSPTAAGVLSGVYVLPLVPTSTLIVAACTAVPATRARAAVRKSIMAGGYCDATKSWGGS